MVHKQHQHHAMDPFDPTRRRECIMSLYMKQFCVTPKELETEIRDGQCKDLLLLDMRSHTSYEKMHIRGAIHIACADELVGKPDNFIARCRTRHWCSLMDLYSRFHLILYDSLGDIDASRPYSQRFVDLTPRLYANTVPLEIQERRNAVLDEWTASSFQRLFEYMYTRHAEDWRSIRFLRGGHTDFYTNYGSLCVSVIPSLRARPQLAQLAQPPVQENVWGDVEIGATRVYIGLEGALAFEELERRMKELNVKALVIIGARHQHASMTDRRVIPVSVCETFSLEQDVSGRIIEVVNAVHWKMCSFPGTGVYIIGTNEPQGCAQAFAVAYFMKRSGCAVNMRSAYERVRDSMRRPMPIDPVLLVSVCYLEAHELAAYGNTSVVYASIPVPACYLMDHVEESHAVLSYYHVNPEWLKTLRVEHTHANDGPLSASLNEERTRKSADAGTAASSCSIQ